VFLSKGLLRRKTARVPPSFFFFFFFFFPFFPPSGKFDRAGVRGSQIALFFSPLFSPFFFMLKKSKVFFFLFFFFFQPAGKAGCGCAIEASVYRGLPPLLSFFFFFFFSDDSGVGGSSSRRTKTGCDGPFRPLS